MNNKRLKLNKELFKKIKLRVADISDRDILLEWRNNPKVRERSFNSHIISREEHEKWFNDVLKRDDIILLIGLLENKRIGQIRFDIKGKFSIVSVNLAPKLIGKGLGPLLILKGYDFLFKNTDCEEVVAEIKPDNIASIKAFSKVGFYNVTSDASKILMKESKQEFLNLIAKL